MSQNNFNQTSPIGVQPIDPAEQSMPNPFTSSVGEAQQLPGFGVAPVKRGPISVQTLLLLLVLVCSVGGLFGMRKLGLGNLTALASGHVEVDLSTVPKLDNRHIEVIDSLNRSRTTNQVLPEMVKKNPFILEGRKITDEDQLAASGREQQTAAERAKAERAEAIDKQLKAMEINGILAGSRPVARINGKVVRVGERLGEFTVKSISGRSVELFLDGQSYTLEMKVGSAMP